MVVTEKPNAMAKKPEFTIPVIDFSALSDPSKRSSVCAEVARACETMGFFQIVNSSVPADVLDEAFEISRDFFEMPGEEKSKLTPELGDRSPKVPIFRLGYRHTPILQGKENRVEEIVFRHYHLNEALEDRENSYTTGSPLTGDVDITKNWWPTNPKDFSKRIERLEVELGKLGDTVMDVFSESLGLPSAFLRTKHHRNASVPRYLKLNYYPKGNKADQDETGIVPHRDSSIFTFVAQGYDTEGLWINPYGEWIPVVPQRHGIIVNVGDILEAWTNGRFRSILHKVISNKATDRHSFAYFVFPANGPKADCMIEPVQELLSEDSPATFTPMSYLEFFMKKKQKNSMSHPAISFKITDTPLAV